MSGRFDYQTKKRTHPKKENTELISFTNESLKCFETKEIDISQIKNASDALQHVLFLSEDEKTNRDTWELITKDVHSGKKYTICVLDITPEINDSQKKNYVLFYGQKRLYAALRLGYKKVKVRVYSKAYTRIIDKKIISEFYLADFSSLHSYEKGAFIQKILDKYKLQFEFLAPLTGIPYGTIRAFYGAYTTANKVSPYLLEAYKNNNFDTYVVLRGKKFYQYGSDKFQQRLTEYFSEFKDYGVKSLDAALKKSTSKDTVRNRILEHIESSFEEKYNALIFGQNKYDLTEITKICQFSEEEIDEIKNKSKNFSIKQAHFELLCLLLSDGLIDISSFEESILDKLEIKDNSRFTSHYLGCLKKARIYYDMLEKALYRKTEAWCFYGFQPDFCELKKMRLIRHATTNMKKIENNDFITDKSCLRFFRYMDFCSSNKVDKETKAELYQDDVIRESFIHLYNNLLFWDTEKKKLFRKKTEWCL